MAKIYDAEDGKSDLNSRLGLVIAPCGRRCAPLAMLPAVNQALRAGELIEPQELASALAQLEITAKQRDQLRFGDPDFPTAISAGAFPVALLFIRAEVDDYVARWRQDLDTLDWYLKFLEE